MTKSFIFFVSARVLEMELEVEFTSENYNEINNLVQKGLSNIY